MPVEKCVKQIGAPFTVLTKLHHMSSSGTVKVFYLYYHPIPAQMQRHTEYEMKCGIRLPN